MYDVAMKLMILEWNIVAPASAVGMAIPAHFAAGIDLLGARDGKAIERHLKPIFETINEGDDPKAQGDSDE